MLSWEKRGSALMDNKTRRREIYEYLKKGQEIVVADMAKMMGVSCMTIRRDLASMEKEGLITRSYGKARLVNGTANELSFSDRLNIDYPLKLAACKEAVKLLDGISTIFLDGSTTSYTLSTLLPRDRKLTVISCNLSATLHLRDLPNVQLVFPGGRLAQDRNSIDIESSRFISEDVFVDAAIVSCGGYSEKGLVDSNLSGAFVRDYMCKSAQCVILIADHTKYHKPGLFTPWKWSDFDNFVTDERPPEHLLRQLAQESIQIHWPSDAKNG